jgi:N-acetylmuramoyl-L-alanine amidase
MGVNYGQAIVTVCQNNGSNCLPITFIVDRAAPVTDPTTNNGTGGNYTFTDDLWLGLDSDGVRELQNFLATTGYFNGTATGYFGTITQDAVMRFQTANGVRATGYVGPLTRDVINSK